MNHFITYLWRVNHCVIVQATCMYNAVRITKKGVSRGIRNARCGFDEQQGRESSPLSFFWKKRGRLIFSCCCFCLCRGQNKGWLRQPAGSRVIYFEAALLREELQLQGRLVRQLLLRVPQVLESTFLLAVGMVLEELENPWMIVKEVRFYSIYNLN